MTVAKSLWLALAVSQVAISLAIAAPPTTMTVHDIKIEGSLDLSNGVPIRWQKPDGTGYVSIFVLDKNGTLRLCDDPYYYDATKTERKDRVIEIRNPNTRLATSSIAAI